RGWLLSSARRVDRRPLVREPELPVDEPARDHLEGVLRAVGLACLDEGHRRVPGVAELRRGAAGDLVEARRRADAELASAETRHGLDPVRGDDPDVTALAGGELDVGA